MRNVFFIAAVLFGVFALAASRPEKHRRSASPAPEAEEAADVASPAHESKEVDAATVDVLVKEGLAYVLKLRNAGEDLKTIIETLRKEAGIEEAEAAEENAEVVTSPAAAGAPADARRDERSVSSAKELDQEGLDFVDKLKEHGPKVAEKVLADIQDIADQI